MLEQRCFGVRLGYLLDVSFGSNRAVALRMDFSFFVGFGSVDVVLNTGPGPTLTVCFSECALALCQLLQMRSELSEGYDEDLNL